MPEPEENPCSERQLRKQLVLLATLLVGVTYLAGNNPPGGVWQQNGSGHKAGDTILLTSHRRKYLAFYYSNSTALAASVVVIFLLLLQKPRRGPQLVMLRVVMVLDLIGFTMAYMTGASANFRTSLYPGMLASFIFTNIIFLSGLSLAASYFSPQAPLEVEPRQGTEEEELDDRAPLKPIEWRKVLMLLASFTTVITYVAGLSSSGGYWDRVDRVESNNQQGNDRLVGLDHKAKARFSAFFYCNATAFMASLCLLVLLLILPTVLEFLRLRRTSSHISLALRIQCVVLYMLVLVALLGLLGAYAAGSYRNTDMSIYVFCLIAVLLTYIFLVTATACFHGQYSSDATTSITEGGDEQADQAVGSVVVQVGRRKSIILLISTLIATISYQAGLDPPGGVWPDDRDGHSAGNPILLSTHPWRYKFFLYCNSGAFVLSLAAILMLMVQKEKIHTRLLVSMMLDMVALMGAYAAGSWSDARSSIYVVAMAGGVIVYVLCVTLSTTDVDSTRLKKRHKRLLLVAILVAIITYQAGLNPPARYQRQGDAAGAVLLMDNYPRPFWAFFYCNTASFMANMALILFFMSPNLYRLAIRCYALYACIVLAMLGLIAAYAAANAKRVQTYAYVFVLLAIMVSVIAVCTIRSRSFLLEKQEQDEEDEGSSAVAGPAPIPRPRPSRRTIPRHKFRVRSAQETEYHQVYTSHKHLMLVGILAAGITYQAGLNPPGSLWQDDSDLGDAGSPVLYDRNRRRYLAFFYSNSTSFVASVFVVALQLQQILSKHQPNISKLLVIATRSALVLGLLGLAVAYAAGTTWAL